MGNGAGFGGGHRGTGWECFRPVIFSFPSILLHMVPPPRQEGTPTPQPGNPTSGGRPTETPTQAQPRARTRVPRAASVTRSAGGRIHKRPSAAEWINQSGIPITNDDNEPATVTHRDLEESQKSNADQEKPASTTPRRKKITMYLYKAQKWPKPSVGSSESRAAAGTFHQRE